MREVAAEFERPVLLFSGGKDSIVLLRLAEKAFRPARVPVPADARRHGPQLPRGDRVPRPPRGRARRAADRRLACRSRSTSGRVVEETGPRASRNRLQTATLLDAIAEHGFDAAFGGARRDEERARAKERIFSFRDDFGQWDPKDQRPELWNLYNGRIRKGEHVRVFPLSNWTELDVWQYIDAGGARGAVDLLRPRARGLQARRDALRRLATHVELHRRRGALHRRSVRYRTVGDMTLHRRRRLDGDRRSTTVVAEIAATTDHRARRDARRRPRVARRRWRTARSPATSRPRA